MLSFRHISRSMSITPALKFRSLAARPDSNHRGTPDGDVTNGDWRSGTAIAGNPLISISLSSLTLRIATTSQSRYSARVVSAGRTFGMKRRAYVARLIAVHVFGK